MVQAGVHSRLPFHRGHLSRCNALQALHVPICPGDIAGYRGRPDTLRAKIADEPPGSCKSDPAPSSGENRTDRISWEQAASWEVHSVLAASAEPADALR